MGLERIIEMLKSLLLMSYESKKITKTAFNHLSSHDFISLDDVDAANNELIHFLKNHKYYDLLERIEKGEAMEASETDPAKKREYQALLKIRYDELEKIMPKEEAA